MIITYLFELLYEQNCVVLPGFGGFIANRLPSRVNEGQQRVEPPRKVVAFNSNLIQNDGLLAHHISGKENISFDEAVLKINSFVEQLRVEIHLKKHTSLTGIGDFYLNSENKIIFVPEADINFSKETFGLFPISIRKIIRETETQKAVEKETLRSKPLPFKAIQTKRSLKWVYGAVLIAMPLALGFFTQSTGMLQKADFNFSSVFNNKPQQVTTPKAVPVNAENNKVGIETHESKPAESIQPDQTVTQKEIKSEVTPSANNANNDVQKEGSHQAIVNSNSNSFHIIGGSFGVAVNAQNFTKTLQDKGYQAYIAGVNAGGLTMVSYGNFATETEALTFLLKIQQSENNQAWLFKSDVRK